MSPAQPKEFPVLDRNIREGRETDKIEFKRVLHLDNNSQKEEFAKDVCAIANAPSSPGYIVVGVNDMKARRSGHSTVPGVTIGDEDAYEIQLLEILDRYCDNAPSLQVRVCLFDGVSIAVIAVRSTSRPYTLRGATTVLTRRGARKKEASIAQVLDMVRERNYIEVYQDICLDVADYSARYAEDVRSEFATFIIDKMNAIERRTDNRKQIYYLLARAHYVNNDYENAHKYIKYALEYDGQAEYWALKAKVLFTDAESQFEAALREPVLSYRIDSLEQIIDMLEEAQESLNSASDAGSVHELRQLQEQITSLWRVVEEELARSRDEEEESQSTDALLQELSNEP